jgi:hypothetical protein
VPEKVRFTGPSVAEFAAENVTDCEAPAAITKGLAGEVVTPEGRPLIATLTLPLKLWSGETVIEAGELALPCVTDTEAGVTAIVKSAGIGGGLLDPPPQPMIDSPATNARTNNKYRLGSVMGKAPPALRSIGWRNSQPRSHQKCLGQILWSPFVTNRNEVSNAECPGSEARFKTLTTVLLGIRTRLR